MSTGRVAEEDRIVAPDDLAPRQPSGIPASARSATLQSSKPVQMLLAAALGMGLLGAPVAQAERPLGIDVSSWTPLTPAEWTAIRNSGRVFGFARASYGWGYSDSQFVNHMTNATAAGIYLGAYHYSYPGYTSGNTPLTRPTPSLTRPATTSPPAICGRCSMWRNPPGPTWEVSR